MGREIYGACGSSLHVVYLMTGMHNITMCEDIVYRKHFRTHLSQISLVSAKNDFSGARTWMRITLERYTLTAIAILTSPLRSVNSALLRGINILKSES